MSKLAKLCLCSIVFFSYLIWKSLQNWPSGLTKVVFCDVGQGDATLITRGTTQVLIDGGPNDKVLKCLSSHLPWWDRQLELVVATHVDADHINGLTSVFASYKVKNFLTTAQSKKTTDFQALLTQIKLENGLQVIAPELGKQLVLGPQTSLQILAPQAPQDLSLLNLYDTSETELLATLETKTEADINYNDGSIALLLRIGEVDVLLTGDLESSGETALLEAGLTKPIEVLKVGHHGSKTSSIAPFIAELRPEFSVVSAGQNNRYGHPAPEVVSRLEALGSHVLRTDQVGNIVLISDGQKAWFDF